METDQTASAGGGGIILLIQLAILVLFIVSAWKIFTKAGKPGWASIIPIYNMIVMLEIVGKPLWWFLLLLIPIVNIVILIIIAIELAKVFGKGGGFAAGLILLPFIFYPILAFGDARYTPPPALPGSLTPRSNPDSA